MTPAAGSGPPAASRRDTDGSDAALVRDRGRALLTALEQYAPGSHEHADAVATYAFAIAVELGIERSGCELIREVTRLHELGRLYVPAAMAGRRRSELAGSEAEQIEQSPAAGAELARGAGVPEEACTWILATRERYDGLGPGALRGDEIPLAARISRAACAYQEQIERTTKDAPGPGGEPRTLALTELGPVSGTLLDPRVLEALARVLGRAGAAALQT